MVVVFGALVTGCVAPIGERSQGLLNASDDTGDSSVVVVFGHPPGSTTGYLCTGEVVSPHVVLTAGHCVNSANVGSDPVFEVSTAAVFAMATANEKYSVKSFSVDPQYDFNDAAAAHDLAVLVLTSAISAPSLAVNRMPLDNSFINTNIRIVGYGDDDAAMTGAGTKRQVSTTLSGYSSTEIYCSDATHQACGGDSGSALLAMVNGVEMLVGVTSHTGGANCTLGEYFERTDVEASVFDPIIASSEPPPDLGSEAVDSAPSLLTDAGALSDAFGEAQDASAKSSGSIESGCAFVCRPISPLVLAVSLWILIAVGLGRRRLRTCAGVNEKMDGVRNPMGKT